MYTELKELDMPRGGGGAVTQHGGQKRGGKKSTKGKGTIAATKARATGARKAKRRTK